jgi:hypothetical protein
MNTCFYFRRIIKSSLDGAVALPDAAQRHTQECATCREIYESERGIIRELRGGAEDMEPSPFLHARIISAIENAGQEPQRKRHRLPASWAAGMAAACALALVYTLMSQRVETPRAPVANASHPATPAALDLALNVKLPDGNQVRQWAGKLDEPLETEQKLVISDAKTALSALADNFLPPKVRQSLFDQDNGS